MCAGALPAVTLVPAVGLWCHGTAARAGAAAPTSCSLAAHLQGQFFSCPAARCAALVAICPMCPAHPSANGLAHACAVGAAAVLQVTAVSLQECCSPSVLPTCSGWLRGEGLRCTKAFNGSHEPVNINYLQAHPPEAEQSRRRR